MKRNSVLPNGIHHYQSRRIGQGQTLLSVQKKRRTKRLQKVLHGEFPFHFFFTFLIYLTVFLVACEAIQSSTFLLCQSPLPCQCICYVSDCVQTYFRGFDGIPFDRVVKRIVDVSTTV